MRVGEEKKPHEMKAKQQGVVEVGEERRRQLIVREQMSGYRKARFAVDVSVVLFRRSGSSWQTPAFPLSCGGSRFPVADRWGGQIYCLRSLTSLPSKSEVVFASK